MKPLKAWRDEAEFFSAHGWRIASWVTTNPDPDAPWLLLIHGFPTSSWDWSAVWPAISARFNLAAADMLGFGLSDKPSNIKYSIDAQADLQEAMLEQLGVGEAHVFAHDYGDTVAQELLARHNEGALSFSLKSVCFLNGGLFPEQHRPRLIQKIGLSPLGGLLGLMMSRDTLRKNFDQIFGENTKASDEEIDGHWELLVENDGSKIFHKLLHYMPERKIHRERWVGALKNARIPLRLINGGQDPVSGRHLYDHYRQELADADAVLLDNIGHYPHTEAPDQVASAFLDFHHKLSFSQRTIKNGE
ncbi:MAG: alpha/beta hydrolase [Pseudomonadota bacterium]